MGFGQAEQNDSSLCIFVGSSAKTCDVREPILNSNKKFFKITKFKTFIGTNYNDPSLSDFCICAPESNWRNELLFQIRKMPSYKYILFLLDDFIIFNFPSDREIDVLTDLMDKHNIDALSFERFRPSLFSFNYLKQQFFGWNSTWFWRSRNDPYYSSLQPCIWKVSHFEELLDGNELDIWDFELLNKGRHAVCLSRVGFFEHLVEKGKWRREARLFLSQDLMSGRKLQQWSLLNTSHFISIKFFLCGYLKFWIRRLIGMAGNGSA